MSTDPNASMKTCPTCGTRVSENAPRCLVCGTTFTQTQPKRSRPARRQAEPNIQGPRMPTMTLSIPLILIVMIIFIGLGGGLTYTALNMTGGLYQPTEEPTATATLIPPPRRPVCPAPLPSLTSSSRTMSAVGSPSLLMSRCRASS
jgi:hypothetical protein